MSKLKIEFGFGIEYRGDGSALLGHEQAAGMKEIRLRAIDLFDGYTGFDTHGAWRDPDTNCIVFERGAAISVLTDRCNLTNHVAIVAMVQQIKDSLQQKAVAVTRAEVYFDIL